MFSEQLNISNFNIVEWKTILFCFSKLYVILRSDERWIKLLVLTKPRDAAVARTLAQWYLNICTLKSDFSEKLWVGSNFHRFHTFVMAGIAARNTAVAKLFSCSSTTKRFETFFKCQNIFTMGGRNFCRQPEISIQI